MKKLLLVLGIVVVLAWLVGLGYWYWQSKQETAETNPNWVNEIINGTKVYDRWDQYEASISKCTYEGQVVYYITYSGDDLYNDLFSTDGEKICSPDGGFSGNGDGQCSDFSASKNDCQLIWKKAN